MTVQGKDTNLNIMMEEVFLIGSLQIYLQIFQCSHNKLVLYKEKGREGKQVPKWEVFFFCIFKVGKSVMKC